MEMQIKKTVKAGNSSAVILPRAWLDREVRVELVGKTREIMLKESMEILEKHIPLESVIGIYLAGSYARQEEDKNSDIDILVITDNIDKEIIHEGIYSILIISSQLIYQKMDSDLFPIGQMLKEAKPLLNSNYIRNIKIKITEKNVKWYLDTTSEKLKIIRKYLDNSRTKKISDRISYTLVLRLRTLEIIKKLIQNKEYSKREFSRLIEKISEGEEAYQGYLAVKNNLIIENRLPVQKAEKLYKYLKKDLQKVKVLI
jgi:predicted nucleotidyltransferase